MLIDPLKNFLRIFEVEEGDETCCYSTKHALTESPDSSFETLVQEKNYTLSLSLRLFSSTPHTMIIRRALDSPGLEEEVTYGKHVNRTSQKFFTRV